MKKLVKVEEVSGEGLLGLNWLNLIIMILLSIISTTIILMNDWPTWLVPVSSMGIGAVLGFLEGAKLIDFPLFEKEKK